jgi:hypothetical protein
VAVTGGAVTSASINNAAASTTFAFTSNGDPILFRMGAWMAGKTLNTVVWDPTGANLSLTRRVQAALSNGDDGAEIWDLPAHAAGTKNIVATFSGTSVSGSMFANNTSGQDAVTPRGNSTALDSAANGTSTGSQTIVGAAAGDLTVAVMCNGNGAAVTFSFTGGSGGAEEADVASNGERTAAAKVSDAVTAISASWTGGTSWAIATLVLKTAGGGGGTKAPPRFTRPWRVWNRR